MPLGYDSIISDDGFLALITLDIISCPLLLSIGGSRIRGTGYGFGLIVNSWSHLACCSPDFGDKSDSTEVMSSYIAFIF